jgi:tRNA nucleotidyltransferase/poly(A) polymerase
MKQSDFNNIIPKDIKDLVELFNDNGYKLYIVGGAVRDFLLGKKPKDFDLATDASPEKINHLLKDKYVIHDVGRQFGLSKVSTKQFPEGIEIVTFRKDIGKGRRPDAVEFTDVQTDALRRDLTINALYYDVVNGKILDFVGGIDDINNKIVRTVGDPNLRFEEDPLRKLRVIRFAGRFDKTPDRKTLLAIKNNPDLSGVSKERIRDEFIKGLQTSKNVKMFLVYLNITGMLPQIFPNLIIETTFHDYKTKHYTHHIAYLLKENDVNLLVKSLNDLRYTSDEVKYITFFVSVTQVKIDNVYRLKLIQNKLNIINDEVKKFLRGFGLETLMTKSFADFRLSYTVKELMDKGVPNKNLSKTLEKLETEKFVEEYI